MNSFCINILNEQKKDSLISHLIRKPTYSIDEIETTIKECKSKSEFIKSNPKMYKFVRRGKLKFLLEKFKNN